jgi:NAD(P)-dependent dehydrogenase (short-subunit alcohol dehydrogenase family)
MSEKIALITGASRGLGRSMALHLAEAGVGIVGTYQQSREGADSLVEEVSSRGGRAAMLQLDVSHSGTFPNFAEQLAQTLDDQFGRDKFDYLVNNAGIGIYASVADTTEEQFDQLINIHLKAPLFLTQAVLPQIEDGGRILNVSTGLARFTHPGWAAYASAKGGVEVLTRYMAQELGERGIRVNVLVPGAIATDFSGGAVRDVKEVNETVAAAIALGRVGLPDDIGAAVPAILSDSFAWADGSRIELSGGQSL